VYVWKKGTSSTIVHDRRGEGQEKNNFGRQTTSMIPTSSAGGAVCVTVRRNET